MTERRPTRPRPTSRWDRPAVVAAEHHADYRSHDPDRPEGSAGQRDGASPGDASVTSDGDTTPDPADGSAERQRTPFGKPVLAELPELAGVLEDLVEADRRQTAAVVALSRHVDPDEVAAASGVGIEHWLGVVARATRMDRRLLLRLARLLARLPQVCGVVEDGLVSFAQLRGLALALKGLPSELDETMDAWLTEAATYLANLEADPDALVSQARDAVIELTDQADLQQEDAALDRRLVLQPRLDGAGGRFWGEEDAYGFAVLDAATQPRPSQRDDAGRARADNLQAWLHHTCPDTAKPAPSDGTGVDDPADAAGQVPAHLLAAAAQAAQAGDPGSDNSDGDVPAAGGAGGPSDEGDPHGDDPAAGAGSFVEGLPGSVQARIAAGRDLSPPKVLVRFDLASLLDHSQVPADILVRLAGGKLTLTSAAARQVIDRAGAQIRAIVVDDGEVVGVGRASRVPPGWLADAIAATHDTCTGPLCDRPALGADLDHAVPWTPDGDTPGGTTDVDNLGPLCAGTNRDRAAVGWEPVQYRGNGMRTWHHERSGLTTTSVPGTWRPPGHRARMAALAGEPDDADPPDEPDEDVPF